jgi:hypothetical protein
MKKVEPHHTLQKVLTKMAAKAFLSGIANIAPSAGAFNPLGVTQMHPHCAHPPIVCVVNNLRVRKLLWKYLLPLRKESRWDTVAAAARLPAVACTIRFRLRHDDLHRNNTSDIIRVQSMAAPWLVPSCG